MSKSSKGRSPERQDPPSIANLQKTALATAISTQLIPQEESVDEDAALRACWDDLNNLSNGCRNLLIEMCGINELLLNKLVLDHITKTPATLIALSKLSTVFQKDMEEYTQRYLDIGAEHKEKRVGADSVDLFFEASIIGDKYTAWSESFLQVVMPNATQITAIFTQAHAELAAAANAVPKE